MGVRKANLKNSAGTIGAENLWQLKATNRKNEACVVWMRTVYLALAVYGDNLVWLPLVSV